MNDKQIDLNIITSSINDTFYKDKSIDELTCELYKILNKQNNLKIKWLSKLNTIEALKLMMSICCKSKIDLNKFIKKDNKILSTERGYGDLEGYWEFPGGKIEPGENKEQALKREIMEEMNVEIKVGDFITTVEYDYPDFHLTMHSFICELEGDFKLLEHHAAKWLTRDELDGIKWCPADIEILQKIKNRV